MSIVLRRILFATIGLLAGLAAWPLVELVLAAQARFPSFLVLGAALGAVIGIVLGGFFGAAEGITSNVKSRIPAGAVAGVLLGVLGGIAGFLVGQGLFLAVANAGLDAQSGAAELGRWSFVAARAFGWSLLGVFVGVSEGVRAMAPRKIVTGVLGGLIGGLLGGLALEVSQVVLTSESTARLLGLLVFGLLIGVSYALIERRMSHGVLLVLNGPLKGREFVVNQSRMRIGTGRRNEVRLDGYGKVADVHALLRARGADLTLQRGEAELIVNDQPVSGEHVFKFEDVVKVGSAKLYFRPE